MLDLKKLGVRRGMAVAAVGAMAVGLMTMTAGSASAHPDPSICNVSYTDNGSWFMCAIGPYTPYQTAVDVARGWENTGHVNNHIIEGSPACLDCWNVILFVDKH